MPKRKSRRAICHVTPLLVRPSMFVFRNDQPVSREDRRLRWMFIEFGRAGGLCWSNGFLKPAWLQVLSHRYSPPVFVWLSVLLHCDVDEWNESDEEDGCGEEAQSDGEGEEVWQCTHGWILWASGESRMKSLRWGEDFSRSDRGSKR